MADHPPTIAEFESQFILDKSDRNNVLGKGGFSSVYKCTRRIDKAEVAVKVATYVKDSEKNVLLREAKICSLLSHQNIVSFMGVYQGANVIHLVFEQVTGGELFDAIVKRSHFSEKEASMCLKDMLSAVEACHEKGIIHRDIKPENLLVTADGRFKLTDFGLAIKTNETKFHGFCGTPAYMAPELVRRLPYNTAIDVWACGTILYILLVGYQPFWSDKNEELYQQIVSGDLSFPQDDWHDVSPAAKELVLKMLCMDRQHRLTVTQCLKEPWVANSAVCKSVNRANTVANLKSFNARRKFKSGAQAVHTAVHLLSQARRINSEVLIDNATPSDSGAAPTTECNTAPTVVETSSSDDIEAEIRHVNAKLIQSILERDWATYKSLNSAQLTCFEPEAPGVLVEGLDFHQFYFDMPRTTPPHPPHTTLANVKVNMAAADVAIVTYVRLTQAVAQSGAPYTTKSEETRVWKSTGEHTWECVHFHRSGAPSAPSK
eukprot:m.669015 g.669015  ORF g.669015 m.669015 type:complete len:489 (-) comp22758_c0_seq28:302-1768(-)